jgi:hypothetical protein
MVAAEVNLIRENDRELYFAHRPLSGVVFMLIGMGIVYFFFFSSHVREQAVRWIFSAGGALFALIGFGGALWRYELRLDLLTRTYSGRRGFWPHATPLKGSLDDLTGMLLTSRVDRSDKSSVTVWTVSLGFQGWDKPVTVMETQTEVTAYGTLEHYAKKLRITAIDRTGAGERRTPWTDLDKPLAEQPDHAISIPPLPAGSPIEFVNRPGRRTIIFPAQGFTGAGLFIFLFGLPFFGMGSFTLWLLLSGAKISGNVAAGYIIGPVLMLVGLFILFLAIAGTFGRPQVQEEEREIVHSLLLFGRRVLPRRITKREVEEVSLRPVTGRNSAGKQELVLRSDRRILRISGLPIGGQDLEWLKLAVQRIAAEG